MYKSTIYEQRVSYSGMESWCWTQHGNPPKSRHKGMDIYMFKFSKIYVYLNYTKNTIKSHYSQMEAKIVK